MIAKVRDKEFAERLRQSLDGRTHVAVGKRIGCSRAVISKYASGDIPECLNILVRVMIQTHVVLTHAVHVAVLGICRLVAATKILLMFGAGIGRRTKKPIPFLTDAAEWTLSVRENIDAFSFSDGAGEGARGDRDRHGSRNDLRIFGSVDESKLWRLQDELCGSRGWWFARIGQLANPNAGDGLPAFIGRIAA